MTVHVVAEPAVSASAHSTSSYPDLVVPSGVIDAHTEALVQAGDPAGRAEIICRVTEELSETIAWLQQSDPAIDELISLEGVLVAAQQHSHRMRQRAATPGNDR